MKIQSFTFNKEVKSMWHVQLSLRSRWLAACFIFFSCLISSYQASAQQYTANFSVAPVFYAGSWPGYNTHATVNLGGVDYDITIGQVTNWSHSSTGGESNSGSITAIGGGDVSVTLKRKDNQRFQFYGVWLKYTNYSGYANKDLRVTYSGSSDPQQTYGGNSTAILSKNVNVTSVSLYFGGLDRLYLDNLIVGPAVASLPTLSTASASNINSTFATAGGYITSDGGGTVTERGLVWSTTTNPTTSNSKLVIGSGTGSFSGQITGLSSNTTYYVRAYAINAAGTAYGNQVTFATVDASGPVTLSPTLDTSFDNDGSYPADNSCYVGYAFAWGEESAALKFSLTPVSGTVTSAKLRLFVNTISGASPFAKVWSSTNEAWTASTISPPATDQALGQVNGIAVNSWIEIDVTNYIKTQVAGSKIASLVVTGNTSASPGEVYFNSMESATNQPQLVITTGAALSSNADLAGITLSTGTLAPGFAAGTTSYTATVANDVSSINITPAVADAKAAIVINGVAAASGSATPVSLGFGTNTVNVKVTAEDGTLKTYIVNVTRQLSSNADLSNLTLNAGTITPSFSSAATSYSVSLPYETNALDVTATAADATAYLKVNAIDVASGVPHNVTISPGNNTIILEVIAQDGLTTKTYNLSVFRTPPSNNANLSNLTLDKGSLSPTFASGTTSYEVSLPNGATAINITPTTADATAAIRVGYTTVTSGNPHAVTLQEGANPITVTVTAQDYTVKEYNINVLVTAPLDAAIAVYSNVSCSGGSDGNATVTVSGGKAPYSYQWSTPNGVNASASNLAAGDYNVLVKDALGQEKTAYVTILQPAALAATFLKQDATSFGGTDGAATIEVTGGVGSYTYTWAPYGGNGATASNLATGEYTVTVKDANNCAAQFKVFIDEPKEVSVESISRAYGAHTKASYLMFQVKFSAKLDGLAASNLSLGGIPSAYIDGVTRLSDDTYNVGVTLPAAESGELSLTVANDTGLPVSITNAPYTGAETYQVDHIAPVTPAAPVLAASSDTGVSDADRLTKATSLTVSGATEANALVQVYINKAYATQVNADASGNWTATLNPTLTAGFNELTITADAADELGNRSEQGAALLVKVERDAPVASLTYNGAANVSTPFTVEVKFDEAVYGLAAEDFDVSNGTITDLATADAANYTITVTPTANGWVTLFLKNASVIDIFGNGNGVSSSIEVMYDDVRPQARLASLAAPVINTTFDVEITFSEAVTGFEQSDVTVTNGVATDFEALNATQYKVTISAEAEGEVKVAIAGNVAQDAATNGNEASASLTRLYDTTNPRAILATTAPEVLNAPLTVILTFTEPVSGFAISDITVTNSSVSDFTKLSDTEYTALVTPAADGEVTVAVAADVANDAATNGNEASEVLSRLYDATRPTVVLATTAADPVNAAFEVSFTFSEDVYGLEVADISVENGVASAFTQVDAQHYTALITPAVDGGVSVAVAANVAADVATNGNEASEKLARVFDSVKPNVALTTTAPEVLNAPFTVTFTFTEPVSDFVLADITVHNATASDFATLSATEYTALITPTVDGEVQVAVVENMAQDAATNGNKASEVLTRTYDVVKPGVALATSASEVLNAAFTVTFTFTEPVSGFALGDIIVTNATATNLTKQSETEYTAIVTPAADGEVTVAISEEMAIDAATNGNEASEVLSRLYDATIPTVVLATTAADPTNTAFEVSFAFSEDVFGFDVGDITIQNGTASAFTQTDAQHYTALITPAVNGLVNVSLAAGVTADLATNANEASAQLSLTYDATSPAGYTLTINTNRVDVTNVSNISLSVAGAEIGTTYTYTITSDNGGTAVTGTGEVQLANFDLSSLDLTGLNDGTLTATLYLVDAAGNKGGEATAQVVKITRDVVAVTTPELIKVPIRTIYANVPMPAKVEVTYSTGAKEQITVTWSQGNYNGVVAGAYELTGELVLAPMTTNITNQVARVVVEVQPNKVPTAITFSATTFKPEAAANDALGTLTTIDPDDVEFVYELVSGTGDQNNDLFEIRNDKVYLKSNKGLSGITSLSFRVRSSDPYLNTIEKSFTLSKELYSKAEDQLKIVNAFSPDGDGINDTWFIPELRFYNSVVIEVFDRSGIRVFQTTNPEEGWNGKDANGQVRKGAFFYIVQVKDINMVKKGVVTILKK